MEKQVDIVKTKCICCGAEFYGYLIDNQWKPDYCAKCWAGSSSVNFVTQNEIDDHEGRTNGYYTANEC